jgi:gamma-glutamylcyclotransferase (GGCT)/AIG2-like uncharacterized protein YtfP
MEGKSIAMSTREIDSALFVYGSLLDARHRREILGRDVNAAPTRLEGFERRHGRYFYVVPHAGAQTPGLLLCGLEPRDFTRLDRYEDMPRLYTRERIEVIGEDGGALRCWIYLPTAALLDGAG